MNTPAKKKHLENNKTVLSHLANKDTIHLPVPDSTSIIPVITPRKNTRTKIHILKFFMRLQRTLRRYQMIL